MSFIFQFISELFRGRFNRDPVERRDPVQRRAPSERRDPGERRNTGEYKRDDKLEYLPVTLEDLYGGATKKFEIERDILCEKCGARGETTGASECCRACMGTGIRIQFHDTPSTRCDFCHSYGPSPMHIHVQMQQQNSPVTACPWCYAPPPPFTETVCTECDGEGETIPESDRCRTCRGKKIIRARKVVEVLVTPGMADGQEIVLIEEGDQKPGYRPGDVVIILQEQGHSRFKRWGNDLILRLKLRPVESFLGFRRVIRTLDDRDLRITVNSGEIVNNGSLKYIKNEGMPLYENPAEKGRLLIKFIVDFPPRIPPDVLSKLESCFPSREQEEVPADAVDCVLLDMEPVSEPTSYHDVSPGSEARSLDQRSDDDQTDVEPDVEPS